MTSAFPPLVYRRLRAPREHGRALYEPPRKTAASLFRENRNRRLAATNEIVGQSLASFSADAQRELLELAIRHTRTYCNPAITAVPAEISLVLTGHQPDLYHPGVWLKNFVADAVARELSAIAINVLIDSDTLRSPTLAVPSGSVAAPSLARIAYDRPTVEVPFEERAIADDAIWSGCGEQVRDHLRVLIGDPLIEKIWPWVVDAGQETRNIGLSFSRARHLLERQWGSETLEVPLSRVVETRSFSRYAWMIWQNLERFQAIYKEALDAYRVVHKIRGNLHPVPDLTAKSGWLESPFWIWNAEDPTRRKLFVYRQGSRVAFSDLPSGSPLLELSDSSDADAVADRMASSRLQGWKIRPRALITTLYARLVLGDLFIHGIGGAKYDQVTDLIIRQFFEVEPPAYMTATATLQLPIPHPIVTEDSLRALERELRDLRFVPERFLDGRADLPQFAREAIETKRQWIARSVGCEDRSTRYHAIKQAVSVLQPFVDEHRDSMMKQLAHLRSQALNHQLLSSREYSWALFPEEFLRGLLLELSVAPP